MAFEGVRKRDARISNTRAVKNLCLVYLSNNPPDLSMMLVSANLWQPILILVQITLIIDGIFYLQ